MALAGPLLEPAHLCRLLPLLFQRQQTKWVLFGVIVLLTGDFAVWLLARIFPPLSLTQNSLVYETVSNFALLLIPLSISIAILRY